MIFKTPATERFNHKAVEISRDIFLTSCLCVQICICAFDKGGGEGQKSAEFCREIPSKMSSFVW